MWNLDLLPESVYGPRSLYGRLSLYDRRSILTCDVEVLKMVWHVIEDERHHILSATSIRPTSNLEHSMLYKHRRQY